MAGERPQQCLPDPERPWAGRIDLPKGAHAWLSSCSAVMRRQLKDLAIALPLAKLRVPATWPWARCRARAGGLAGRPAMSGLPLERRSFGPWPRGWGLAWAL